MGRFVWPFHELAPLLYPGTLKTLLILTGGLILLSILVRVKWTLPFDLRMTTSLQRIDIDWITRLARWLTFMGNGATIIPMAILGIAVASWQREPEAGWFLFGTLIALPINAILKKINSRERPGEKEARIYGGPRWGHSYPSGHSMGASAFYCFLAAQLYLHGWTESWKLSVVVAVAALPILIGISRIYLGAHWFSDVVGGWAGGAIVATAGMALYAP